MMARIYVASSWRNPHQPWIVELLRQNGHQVYDFRYPPNGVKGFAWSEIDPEWQAWSAEEYRRLLTTHPIAARGFLSDLRGLQWADTCVLVLPCGRSAHLEAGWFCGQGKRTIILTQDGEEPELMALLATDICTSPDEVLAALRCPPMPDLTEKITAALAAFDALSPEERQEMMRRQSESWARGEIGMTETVALMRSSNEAAGDDGAGFQARVQPWMMACFGPEISADRIERNHRFLEESLELVQSTGCTRSEAHQLVDYVYGRPVGETCQEIGGVMVTLAALCLAIGEDMHDAGETELARIWTKVEKIRAKQAAKPRHSPLPEHVEVTDIFAEYEAAVDANITAYAEWMAIHNRTAAEVAVKQGIACAKALAQAGGAHG